MSKADIDRFVADLKKNPALLAQVKAGSTGLASVVSLAKSKGYNITIDEAKAYIDEKAHQELSDDQLDAVAGGKGGGGGSTTYTSNVAAVSTAAAVATVEAAATATTAVEVAEGVTSVVAVAEAAIVLT